MEGFREACGIVAVAAFSNGGGFIQKVYTGLMSIQHRGQESAGIAVAKDGGIHCYKNKGLVSDVFNEQILSLLNGEIYLGHVTYSAKQDRYSAHAQPYVINYRYGTLAAAFNGALTNGPELRGEMEESGAIFATTSDCETAAALVARCDRGDVATAVKSAAQLLKGGFALAFMTGDTLIGVRDLYGIRPLSLGTVNGCYALASESCAFDMMEGSFIRDVEPGEIVVIRDDCIISLFYDKTYNDERASCLFEYVYFANPDSTLDGINVFQFRERAGEILAEEHPAEADIVIGVPDSAAPAALGFAKGSGIPYTIGIIKNRYVARTFIQPLQSQREQSVRIKLNPIKPVLAGKRVALVDDSIVRGTTMRYLISAIRNAGAKSVHLRISSPPVLHGCRFGVDTHDTSDLMTSRMTTEEIRVDLGADSLAYISFSGIMRSLGAGNEGRCCTGCFNGMYPEVEYDNQLRL